MDPRRFEELSRRVGAAANRRAAVKALATALAAPVLIGVRGEDAEAGIPIVNCKAPGKKCSSSRRCCSGRCKKGRCSCSKKGRPCWVPLEGALCCSQKCRGGKCG
ncbi:MAG: hypothetical protein ACRDJC_01515 [Thermomicrobiales bacterium]